MATILDLGLLRAFDAIFPAILAWALVFALLQKTKAITDSVSLNAVIAVAAAFMILLSDAAINIINFMMPWFTVAIIFFTLLLLVFYVLGLKDDQLSKVVTDKGVYWTLIGVGLIIVMAALANQFGQTLTEDAFAEGGDVAVTGERSVSSTDYSKNLLNTFRNPKVLALLLIFAIAIFATFLLTGQ